MTTYREAMDLSIDNRREGRLSEARLLKEYAELLKEREPPEPRCVCCKTTKDLYKDGWYGYRCNKETCMVF